MSIKAKTLLSFTLFLIYLLGSIFIFCYEFLYVDKTYNGYAVLVIIGSIVHLLLYLINEGYRNKVFSCFLILAIIGIIIGILFFICNFTFKTLCILWGVLDIIRGTCEIVFAAPKIKENKLQIIDIIASLIDIVLGILLCIHLNEGLHIHVIFFGVTFILCSFEYPLEVLINHRRKNISQANNFTD